MDIMKILDLKYLFIQNPFPLNSFQRNVLIVVFSIFIIVAIIVASWNFWKRNKLDIIAKRVFTKISIFCFTLGLIGWVLFFMRQFHVHFFSRRFLLVFWSIGAIIWFVYLLKYILKKAPVERRNIKKKQEFEKYLPRKNNR